MEKPNTEVNACRYEILDINAIGNYLLQSPMERTGGTPLVLDLPMPDGSYQKFGMVESPVMEAGLMAKYPSIKTYSGQGIDDPNAVIRISVTEIGFHAMMLYPGESVFIDPINFNTTTGYIIYNKSDAINTDVGLVCGFDPAEHNNAINAAAIKSYMDQNPNNSALRSAGDTLRTYRLALACTGEYAQSFGGTPTISSTLAHMVISVNRVNEVYEKEISVHLNLVAHTDTLVFLNGTTDPYTNNDGPTMLGENQTVVTARIGSLNYDIGHVFSTGGGGIAGLGIVCTAGQKARGVTGSPSPVGDAFDIDYVAHEMGHQFGGNHPFNGTVGSCGGGNRNTSTAYEPGSGSTIMAYAGICVGSTRDDLQPHSDAYFHTISFDEIRNYTTYTGAAGNSCAVKTTTGNHAPAITSLGGNAYTIPKSTPFTLTGAGTDPDGDPLTFCWEEFDLGPACAANVPTGNAPSFRSYNPTVSPSRTFPSPAIIIANYPVNGSFAYKSGETLPSYARTLKFRLTARDNRSGSGGVTYDPAFVTLTVDATKGPLLVTLPNTTGLSYPALSTQNVTWDVAGTDQSPINTSNVNILLSVDSGKTWPYTLAANVPNNGLASVVLPNVQTIKARVRVEAVGNVFFDISNFNFTITAPVGINENTLSAESVSLYPNPSNGTFNLSWAGKYVGAIELKVLDVTGRTVLVRNLNKSSAGFVEELNLGKPAAGVYTIQADTKQGTIVRKLVVE